MIKNKLQNGASLLEIVIAVGLVSIILLALVSLSTKSVSNTTLSREKNEAARYSQEAVEWLRRERDNSWTTFMAHVDNSDTWCLTQLDWSNSGSCGNSELVSGTNLTREVTFDEREDGVVGVSVIVKWMEGEREHQSVSDTVLTKWQ